MDKEVVKLVNKKVYQKFPEMAGSSPKIKLNDQPQAKTPKAPITFVLTYNAVGTGMGGRQIPRRVRVVANEKGRILRMSTSR
jgi:hypothetical protein